MAIAVRQPTRGRFENSNGKVSRRKDCGDARRGDVFVLYPPEEIHTVRHGFEGRDSVEGVQPKVSTKGGSIRRHESYFTPVTGTDEPTI